jgi:hypothetical protein
MSRDVGSGPALCPGSAPQRLEAARRFYRTQVPEQLNDALREQAIRATGDAEAARVLEDMRAVRSSILVEVDSEGELDRFTYDIDRGETRRVDAASRPPFLALRHALGDFESIRRECGDSLLGFLGSLVGLSEHLCLTARLVRSLRELDGRVTLEQTGVDGFSLEARFGPGLTEPSKSAAIRIDPVTWRALRRGELDPQDAFLDGRLEVVGDEGLAIGLALAAMAPA